MLAELDDWLIEGVKKEIIDVGPIKRYNTVLIRKKANPVIKTFEEAVYQDEEEDDLDTCERPIPRRPTVNVTKTKRAIWPGLR